MLTAEQCQTHAEECKRLAAAPGVSARRTTVLRTMTRSWAALANAIDRYEAFVREDSKPAKFR